MAGLDFDSTLNNDKLKKGLEDMKQMIRDGVDGASESGKKLSSVFDELDRQGVKIGEGIRRGLSEQATGGLKEFTNELTQNITIQKEALSELESEYKTLEQTINAMPAHGLAKRELLTESNKIKAQIDSEKKSLKDLETVYKSFSGETGNLQTRIRNLREEMASLDLNNQADVQRYRELSKEAQGYQSTLNSLNREIREVGKNRGIEIAVGSLNVLSGAMTTATGVQALFAKDNERLQELMVRLQAVMSVSIGIQQLSNQLNKESNLIVRIKSLQLTAQARAQDLATKGTIRATIAQRALNLVAKANPYVLIAGALLSVVGAFALFSKGANDAVKAQRELNKEISEATSSALIPSLSKYRELQIAWDNLGGSLEKQTKFIRDNKDEFKELGVEVNNVNEATTLLVDDSEKFVKAMTLRARSTALAQVAQEKFRQSFDKKEEARADIQGYEEASAFGKGWSRFWSTMLGKKSKIAIGIDLEESGKGLLQDKFNLDKEIAKLYEEMGISLNNNDKKNNKTREETLQQALKREEQLWRDYYDAVANIGEDKAKDIYRNLINVDSSFLKELENEMEGLMGEDNLTQKQVEQLNLLKKTIDELRNQASPFEKQRKDMQEAIKGMDTYTEKIGYLINLRSTLGDSFAELSLMGDIDKELDDIEDARQQMIDNILEKQQTYEEQSLALTQKYNDLKVGQSAEVVEKLNKELSEKLTEIWLNAMGDDEAFTQIFTNMDKATTEALEKFRDILIDRLNETKSDVDKIKLGEFIEKIENLLTSRNPFKTILIALKAIGDEGLSAEEKLALISEGLNQINIQMGFLEDISTAFRGVFSDLGVEMDSAIGDIMNSIDGVLDGVGMAVNGVASMIKGLAPGGNPLEAISGAMGVIGGAVKGISSLFGGGSAERAMRRYREETERLQRAYEKLNYEIGRALGDDIFSGQIEGLRNLEEQLRRFKERRDGILAWQEVFGSGYMADDLRYIEQQIEDTERLINEMLDSIEESFAQTHAKDLARELGDALVGAFERGEDSAEAMNKVVDNMFRNMIRQAVNTQLQLPIQAMINDLLLLGGYNAETGEGTFDITKITEEDLDAFKQEMQGLEDSVEGILDLMDLIDGTSDGADALSGAIQGMSQETASILAGQFNAIRIHVAQILTNLESNSTNSRDMLASLSNIEVYTRNLVQMRLDLSELNSKTSNNNLRGSGL